MYWNYNDFFFCLLSPFGELKDIKVKAYFFKFKTLTLADLRNVNPFDVDVDSIVYGFSSLSAYKPMIPFDVNVEGACTPCLNIKLLNGIYGSALKVLFERFIETD